ncbi:DegT/DnrJ/EryC1/StrS family aminotransferase [Chitinolyticbacter meiyuanensis]|uniref:DegT/DnrJ/EryC1/StrS family aminotransferase n=1 Tax=Chitinolyticbacter meiyuanensis TaxID=682798 RepID=UPI0035715B8C
MLEEKLPEYVGARHCITVANGTDALQIAQMALEIGPGDEVIRPAFSFIATAEATALLGARPVYVDIDPLTFNLDPALLEAAITPRTKAIIPVSLYGQCADYDAINAIAARHGIPVVKDAAQSFSATYKGRKSGNLTTIACTSFFPSMPLGCDGDGDGDGGAIFTNDEGLAKAMRQIARHGQERHYHHVRVGVNSRLDTLQAAILLPKLAVLDNEIVARQQVNAAYQHWLFAAGGPDTMLKLPVVLPENQSAWAQYTVQSACREKIQRALQEQGIPTAVHYPLPLHRQPAVADPAITAAVSESVAHEVVSLPMHPYLQQDEVARIAKAIHGVAT